MSRQKPESKKRYPTKKSGGKMDDKPIGSTPAARDIKLNEGATITDAGSAAKNRTGDWRTFRPVVDLAKCTGCGICVKFCPDNALKIVDVKGQKKVRVDYEHCKGCLICIGECPFKVFTSERERHADTNTAEFRKEGVC